MKIALVAPIEETVPPIKYGGTEWIVYHLAHGLGAKGHQVDLYAPGNSQKEDRYTLIPTVEKSIRTDTRYADMRERSTVKFMSLAQTVRMVNDGNYDIVHNHSSWRFILFSPLLNKAPITTHHGPLSIPHETEVFEKYKDLPYVSISNNQRRDMPQLNFVGTVYNGVDIAKFPFEESRTVDSQAGMVFLARMSPEKGGIQAAEVAKRTKKFLKIAAKIDTVDKPYYEEFKNMGTNEYVSFEGEIEHPRRLELLQNARCLIVPIQWEEPFGLMFTEAMACGTPVITYSRGSAPEVVADGKTGFLVNQSSEYNRGSWTVQKTGIEGLCEAVERIYSMSDEEYTQMRRACRKHVEEHFTTERMVDEYEKIYAKILGQK